MLLGRELQGAANNLPVRIIYACSSDGDVQSSSDLDLK